jgi:hypothetical protein
VNDTSHPTDDLVSLFMNEIRPKLEAGFRAAYKRGGLTVEARYEEEIAKVTATLSGWTAAMNSARARNNASATQMTEPTADRAALGTVKPRVLELVSRDMGASIKEIETTGIKRNSVRGTLYSLQRDGIIRRDGDRWYAVNTESYEASSKLEKAS